MQVCDPLSARNRKIQELYAVPNMHRDGVPKEGRIFVDKIRGRRISQLAVQSDFFKLRKRICFLGIDWIAQLPDQIGGLCQFRFESDCRDGLIAACGEACQFNCLRNPRRVHKGRTPKPFNREQFGPIDVIGRECGRQQKQKERAS